MTTTEIIEFADKISKDYWDKECKEVLKRKGVDLEEQYDNK